MANAVMPKRTTADTNVAPAVTLNRYEWGLAVVAAAGCLLAFFNAIPAAVATACYVGLIVAAVILSFAWLVSVVRSERAAGKSRRGRAETA